MRRILNIAVGPIGTTLLGIVALVAGFATFAVMAGLVPSDIATKTSEYLLGIDTAIVAILAFLIASRLVLILRERRRGTSGSRLYVRMVLLFGVMAVLPTAIVATLNGYMLNTSLQEFFSGGVKNTLDDALKVSVAERQRAFQASVLPLLNELTAAGPDIMLNKQALSQVLSDYLFSSGLSEAALVDQFGTPIARGRGLRTSEFVRPSISDIQQIMQQSRESPDNPKLPSARIVKSSQTDSISALVLVYPAQSVLLYVTQPIDPELARLTDRIQKTAANYVTLEQQRSNVQLRLAMVLVIIVLVMLLLAIWIGISFATRLSAPLSALIGAAERVRGGDLTVRVPETASEDELGLLSREFNRMTGQLGEQRQELVAANTKIDERRRFTEAVLSGVTSAVISLDTEGKIELANRAANELFGVGSGELLGVHLSERVPGLASLLALGLTRPNRIVQEELEFRRNGETRTLLTRVAVEQFGGGDEPIELRGRLQGFVVTFDDVTELLSAQRKAAWADVARRIAHEIKNPLTPIQLSAERLKRKYLKQITDDPETFSVCTDTIIRQVGDIGRMVDEFSSFARMPRPVLQPEDLKEICLQALFLQRNAQPQIVFSSFLPDHPVELPVDRRQIGQALTNLLKNAGEAIEGRLHVEGQALPQGEISVRMEEQGDKIAVIVEDNGKGLPQAERSRLTEPYVTTRAKGTGLGLAIVKKIMEDHGGYLLLEDREGGGARVTLVFLRSQAAATATSQQQSPPLKTATHGA